MSALSPLHQAIVDALAEAAVDDYLTAQATPGADSDPERSERVPLRDLGEAA